MEALHHGNVTLRYVDEGDGAPPLLFVHGWACDHTHFAPQAAQFAPRHRVVSLDQRGFGTSDAPEQDYTLEGFADDLAAACEGLDLQCPVIVGHSLGGAVAFAAAARHPKLASGLVLCDPAVFYPAAALAVFEDLATRLTEDDYLDTARIFAENALFLDSDDPALKTRITARMLDTPQHVMVSAIRHLARLDSETTGARVRVPILCILAAKPFVEVERFRSVCPQVEVVQTKHAGHFHQLLAPTEVNAHIERFLGQLR